MPPQEISLRYEANISGVCSCLCYCCKVNCWIYTRAIILWWLAPMWTTGNYSQRRNYQRLSLGFVAVSVGISTGKNMALCHLPESSLCCIGSQSYGNCIVGSWGNCTDWLSEHIEWAQQHYHRNLLHWFDWKSSGGIEGEETRKVASWSAASPGQFTCSHVTSKTGYHQKCLFYWTTPSPIMFLRLGSKWLNWRDSWKDTDLLTTKMLYAWQMAVWKMKMNNSSTVDWNLIFG